MVVGLFMVRHRLQALSRFTLLAVLISFVSQPNLVEVKAFPSQKAVKPKFILPKWMTPLGNVCGTRDFFDLSLLPSPEAHMPTPQIISRYGYPVETHRVTTKDGYILTLFRIPHGKKDTKSNDNFPPEAGSTRPAVLLQHGLMTSSSDWLMQPEDKAFPYILANAGYDVWLGNARGSTYSKKHERLSPMELEFWKFSFDEMGRYDVPAVIDYILETTKEPKLYYIGHSMGGTMFFITMSIFPEYNDKIRSAYGLAPAVYVEHISTPMLSLESIAKPIQLLQNTVGYDQLLPPFWIPVIKTLGPIVCAPTPVALKFCSLFFFIIGGFDPCQLNGTQQISNIAGHSPDTASARSLEHYLQMHRSTRFRAFDYISADENIRVYGRERPPDYNLTKVTSKVAVFWGQNDVLVSPADEARLMSELPNLIANHRVAFDLWSHIDFMYGIDARILVYDEVIKLMAKNY